MNKEAIDDKIREQWEFFNRLTESIRFKLDFELIDLMFIEEELKDSALDDLETLNEKLVEAYEHLGYMVTYYGEEE